MGLPVSNSSLILDKPFGFKRTDAQRARNIEAFRRLTGGALAMGELYAIVTGQRLTAPEHEPMPASWAPASTTRSSCKDCREPIKHQGDPLSSQPARCRPCGQAKRQEHNNAQQARNQSSLTAQEPVLEGAIA